MSYRTTLVLPNSPGTIDSDYRGELKILMGNAGTTPQTITHGDRIAQMVVGPVVQVSFQTVTELSATAEGPRGLAPRGTN